MRTAGILLDIYDDPKATVLIRALAHGEMPEKLGSSQLLSATELAEIPDRLFALVGQDDAGKVRKYAMHDEAHLATSLIYFLDRHDELPTAAQKTAAERLLEGCSWYEIDPPEELCKIASGMQVTQRTKTVTQLSAAAEKGIQNGDPTEIGPGTPARHTISLKPEEERAVQEGRKTASVDLRGERPPVVVQVEHHVYAMPHEQRYPIDTPELCKRAEAYFAENFHAFTPFERRVYAQSLWNQAEALGTKVASREVLAYSGSEYGPNISGELLARIQSFEGTGHEVVYEALASKVASVPPYVMAQLIEEADQDTGAARAYGRPGTGFRDAYASTFGQPKHAAETNDDADYQWDGGAVFVTGTGLCSLARYGTAVFDELFGEGFGKSFLKDPVGIFKSLPDPQKRLVANLINSSALHVASA